MTKMQRKSFLIIYRDKENKLNIMGCPLTVYVNDKLKAKKLDFLDKCKDYLLNPVIEKGKTEPNFMNFKNRELLKAHVFQDRGIGLLLMVLNEDPTTKKDKIEVMRYTLRPQMDKFEFKESVIVSTRWMLGVNEFFVDMKLFGQAFYIATAYRAEMVEEPKTKEDKLGQKIVEICFIAWDIQSTVKIGGVDKQLPYYKSCNYIIPENHGIPQYALGMVQFSNVNNNHMMNQKQLIFVNNFYDDKTQKKMSDLVG